MKKSNLDLTKEQPVKCPLCGSALEPKITELMGEKFTDFYCSRCNKTFILVDSDYLTRLEEVYAVIDSDDIRRSERR